MRLHELQVPNPLKRTELVRQRKPLLPKKAGSGKMRRSGSKFGECIGHLIPGVSSVRFDVVPCEAMLSMTCLQYLCEAAQYDSP